MQHKFYKEFPGWCLSRRVQCALFGSPEYWHHKKALLGKYASIIAFPEVSRQQI